jgi:hypothetical protein
MPSLMQYIGKVLFEAPGSAATKKTGELISKKGKVKPKVVVYTDNTGGTAAFEEPDYDWEQIQKAMHADAWLNQAFLKYKELMWKEGYYLKSADQDAVIYLKKRFQILGLAQNRAMDDLLTDVSDSLVRYHNAFLIKARDSKPYDLSGFKVQAVIGTKPVGGYFIAPVETMLIKVDKNGNVLGYQQDINGIKTDFKPEDVIHFTYDREPGTQWGHPWILSVLEDLRSLRLMEEDMLNVYHKEVTPVYIYKIGGEDGRYMIEQEDIDAAQEQVKEMHDVGAMVMPGSDSLDVIGSKNASLDITPYIDHWRGRVISGFGLSEHHLGLSSNANKVNAAAMDSALYDKLKSYQSTLENAITLEIIFELLLEGGFAPFNPTGDDQMVFFEFKEIDLESRVKLENHISVLWLQNMITHGQMREMLGLDVDPVHKEEYHLDMVEITLTELSGSLTGPEGGTNPNSPAKGTAGSKDNPANQKGNRGAPKIKKSSYNFDAAISNILNNKEEDPNKIISLIEDLYLELLFVKEKKEVDLFYRELISLASLNNITEESKNYIKNKLDNLIVDVTI